MSYKGTKAPTVVGNKFALGNNGGRPTKYNDDMPKKVEEYLSTCVDEEYIVDKGGGRTAIGTRVNLPTLAGAALYLGVDKETITEWTKIHKEFSVVINVLRQAQESVLVNKGLSGDYHPLIAKVLLTKHGYSDKQEIDHTTKGESIKEYPDTNLDRIADEVVKKLKAKKTKNEIRA